MILESSIKLEHKRPVSLLAKPSSPFRIFRPKLEIKQCKKLYGCYAFCPENSIVIEKGYPKIRYESCTGCLVCVRECECRALSEEREHA